MSTFLQNHPFAVEAFFERSLVITFAVPKDLLSTKIPPCLTLDTFNNEWGFLAVALVQTKGLRPKGFPSFLGKDFFLIGYRIFVRYLDTRGKSLRGLYIIKSETDRRRMELLGNIFTHYAYTTTDIRQQYSDGLLSIKSNKSDFEIEVRCDSSNDVSLPVDSPFTNWKEARRFAGPLPFTFTYDNSKKEVLIVEGVRQHWTPRPVEVVKYHFGFLDQSEIPGTRLANAFLVEQIPYYWKKGRIEKWKV